MKLTYLPEREPSNAIYVAASDDETSSVKGVDLFMWSGDRPCSRVAFCPLIGANKVGLKRGLARLADCIDDALASGKGPVIYAPHPRYVREARALEFMGEDYIEMRSLSFAEMNLLRELEGTPALRLAA